MIRDISIGRYFPAKSFVHAMDARAKLLLTLAMIVVTFLCKNLYSLAALCVFTILIYLSSRLKPLLILKSLKPLLPLLMLMMMDNYLSKQEKRQISEKYFTLRRNPLRIVRLLWRYRCRGRWEFVRLCCR